MSVFPICIKYASESPLRLGNTANPTDTSKGHHTHQDGITWAHTNAMPRLLRTTSGTSPSAGLTSLNLDAHNADAELSLPSMPVKSKESGYPRM